MQGCIPRFSACCVWALCVVSHSTAQAAEVSPTWIDDAQLHDVRLVGSKFAVAVGEHGAIWKSNDGARQWSRLNCGLDVSLRSVCFLDDQVGWIAGCDIMPYSGQDSGILLATRDGGKTWQRVGRESLPALSYVKFFNLEEGVVVGQQTSAASSGIFKTSDGGQTWHGVQGEAPQAWKAACFVQAELGVVAGANSRVSMMGGEQLFASRLTVQGLRSVRAINLSSDDVGWLAGDGGLVLKTATGGVVWESPTTLLPEELREGMDFRAVEVRGEKIWLAGSPGSVIWHSPEGGNRWVKQLTGQPTPLSAIRFSNDQFGVAVGAFGVIVRTEDGGKTWQAVRGNDRRAAMLSLHTRPGMTSAPLLTKLSGELGYRSAVWIAQRTDFGPLAVATDSEARLQAAVQKCGAHAADIHWQLPLTVPGIEFSSEKLLAEWQKQTEGRLPQTLLGGLVRQIRTWRPNIVIIDQPASDDAACQLLFDAALRAIGQAADATRYVEQSELTGLAPWNVDRVYVRLAGGATGDAHIDLDEFLPYLKSSTRIASSSSIALLQSGRVLQTETADVSRTAYRWMGLDGKPADEASKGLGAIKSASRSRDFFGGMAIAPGSASRREMVPIDESNMERLQKLVQKQRNFGAITQKQLDDPRIAGQMLGQINGIVDGMDPQQAAIVLRDLVDEYRKRSLFEMVEATNVELIQRYPQEPCALDAMRWLIQFWCSSETAWQRSRAMSSSTTVTRTKSDQPTEYVDQALAQSGQGVERVRTADNSSERAQLVAGGNSASPMRMATKLEFNADPSTNKKGSKPGRLKISHDVDWRSGAVSDWQARAGELAKKLEIASPSLYRSPEIQFPLAALRRTKGSIRGADAIMRNFVTNAIDAETKQLAERELWTSFATVETPQAMAICSQVSERPHLDGLLSDACWENARELRLSAKPISLESLEGSSAAPHTMVMFAYDPEFLYVAFSVPRAAGTSRDQPQLRGRQRDADLSRHDRVSIRLDIDRDYSTWYEFHVDQRGWTAESCWEDRRWNPTWFVAAEGDETNWRIEAAIPWSDLTPTPPQRGTIYGVSILRTIPTVGLQSWTHPAKARPEPSSFGFLKFE